jgi:pimeloyl-ACP methyl ester carboxylesterase
LKFGKRCWLIFALNWYKNLPVFVGNSIDALLSLMMLANHPDLARGGILLNAAGGLNHRPDELTLPLRVVMGTFVKLVGSDRVGPFLFNLVPRSRALARH